LKKVGYNSYIIGTVQKGGKSVRYSEN